MNKRELNKLLNATGQGSHKAQWRRLALKMHPNKGGNSNTFKVVSAAYNKYYKEGSGSANVAPKANATARAYANTAASAAFAQAMHNFLHPKRKPPPPPSENEKRRWNIMRKQGQVREAWKGANAINAKLKRTPIVRFKNQANVNFFRNYVTHPYQNRKGPGNGRNLKSNRNYYFIPVSIVPDKNRHLFALNISKYSTSNWMGLVNKNKFNEYLRLKK